MAIMDIAPAWKPSTPAAMNTLAGININTLAGFGAVRASAPPISPTIDNNATVRHTHTKAKSCIPYP